MPHPAAVPADAMFDVAAIRAMPEYRYYDMQKRMRKKHRRTRCAARYAPKSPTVCVIPENPHAVRESVC